MKKARWILGGCLLLLAGLGIFYKIMAHKSPIIPLKDNQPFAVYLSHEQLFQRYQAEQNIDTFGPPVYLELDDVALKKELTLLTQEIPEGEKAEPGEGVMLGGFPLEIIIHTKEDCFSIGFCHPNLLYISNTQASTEVWICPIPKEKWDIVFNHFSTYDSGGRIYTMTELFGTYSMTTGEKTVGLLEK